MLPKGATVLDCAYDIHSDLGNHCIGAKVNHFLVPMSHVLKSGDQVEILTSDKQLPKPAWIDYAITARAKTKIRDSFKQEQKKHIEEGRIQLTRQLEKLNVKVSANTLIKLINHYGLHTKEQLYAEIGMGLVSLDNLETTLLEKSVNKFIKFWKLSFGGDKKNDNEKIDKQVPFLLTENQKNENYILAPCCNPIPGDDVVGFVSDEEKIMIHNKSCPEALKLMSSHGDQIVEASWTKSKMLSYLIHLFIRGIDQQGIANKITSVISNDYQINMRSISLESHDGIFEGNLYLYVHNTDMLDTLVSKLLNIKGVDTVIRKEN